MSEHGHEPNPMPPSDDPTFSLVTPDGAIRIGVGELRALPAYTLPDSYIVSTGHGMSGPFVFGGATLRSVIERFAPNAWTAAEVVSADGFGTRVAAAEWLAATSRPILLAYAIDGRPLTRAEGLVRLITPTETDEALRQIKWVGEIRME